MISMIKKTDAQGELVYGINPIVELLKAKRRKLISVYTTKPTPKSWDKIERLLPERIQIQYVSRDVLTKIAGTSDHQGVLAWAQPFIYRKKPFDPARQKHLILLDGIQDARNLGAILRSAYCTHFDGIVLPQKGTVPLNAAALKASAGLAEHLEIYWATSAHAAVQELHAAGYQFYMAAFKGENATSIAYKQPLCLVIGSEGFGISPALLKMGTQITLPQISADVSYNASVAAGILLFLIANQLHMIE